MTFKESEEKDKEKASPDVLARYFSDMAAVKVLDGTQEIAAVRRIEELEGDLLRHMLSNRDFCRNSLYQLAKMVGASKEEIPDIASIIRAVSNSSPSRKAMYTFVRTVRFSDAGRQWMHLSFLRAQDPTHVEGRRPWIRALRQKFALQAKAKNDFVSANLRLVIVLSKRYRRMNATMTMADLIQEGNIGLMRAVERFDVERGYKFSTYASWWIKHHLRRAIEDKEHLVRVPVHLSGQMYKLGRIEGKHLAEFGENMDVEDLAKEAKIPLKKAQAALAARGRQVLSLDAPMGGEDSGDATFMDATPDQDSESPLDNLITERRNGDVREMLRCLTQQEADILRWRFGLDSGEELTLQEVANKYGLSRERIRQLESRALQKLRGQRGAREWKFDSAHKSE